MRTTSHHALGVLAMLLIGASSANIHAGTYSNDNWMSMGGFPGVNGRVRAAVTDSSGNLYIGGGFTIAGDVFASRVERKARNERPENQ